MQQGSTGAHRARRVLARARCYLTPIGDIRHQKVAHATDNLLTVFRAAARLTAPTPTKERTDDH
jgi:aspartate carbamoyltransferase catalytic subunit